MRSSSFNEALLYDFFFSWMRSERRNTVPRTATTETRRRKRKRLKRRGPRERKRNARERRL